MYLGSGNMSNNKEILKCCPNFYKIINFNPLIEDELSFKIIEVYKEYIFKIDLNNIEQVDEIKKLDNAIAKYINDYTFRKEMKNQILELKVRKDCKDIIKYFVEQIIKIFTNYEDTTTRIIYISRWI